MVTKLEHEYDPFDDDDCCWSCAGDGWVYGYDLDDPLWYNANELYRCENCGGSGKLEDCTTF